MILLSNHLTETSVSRGTLSPTVSNRPSVEGSPCGHVAKSLLQHTRFCRGLLLRRSCSFYAGEVERRKRSLWSAIIDQHGLNRVIAIAVAPSSHPTSPSGFSFVSEHRRYRKGISMGQMASAYGRGQLPLTPTLTSSFIQGFSLFVFAVRLSADTPGPAKTNHCSFPPPTSGAAQ